MTVTLEEIIARLNAENAELRETVVALRETVAKQHAIIRKFQAMLFEKKSEKGNPETSTPAAKDLDAETIAPPSEEEADAEAITPPSETTTAAAPKGKRGRRLYEELQTREEFHELTEEKRRCPTCGASYEECGTEDSSEVEWKVTITRVIHRRKKYRRACCCCDAPALLTAPPPPKLIPKGLLTVSSIANLVIDKFLHGQPINRQLNALELRCGQRFAPGTLVGILVTVGCLLRPLYDAILLHLRDANHWHADETRWMQFADERKKRWWFWVFAATDAVVFVLDPTRSRAVPLRVFGLDDTREDAKRAQGILNCDRWKSYQKLLDILAAYCWAHVRRDFKDLGKGYPRTLGAWSRAWVERIGQLYYLNKQRLSYEPGTEEFRQADARLRDHVEEIARVRDKECADPTTMLDARKALESLKRHWDGLTLFLDHPEVPLDNNEAERLLRLLVVGRKNFYGSGSLRSGTLTESVYSVLMTVAKHDLNPLTYLRAYLNACADNGGKAPANIDRFLPWKASAEDLAAWKLPPTAA